MLTQEFTSKCHSWLKSLINSMNIIKMVPYPLSQSGVTLPFTLVRWPRVGRKRVHVTVCVCVQRVRVLVCCVCISIHPGDSVVADRQVSLSGGFPSQ